MAAVIAVVRTGCYHAALPSLVQRRQRYRSIRMMVVKYHIIVLLFLLVVVACHGFVGRVVLVLVPRTGHQHSRPSQTCTMAIWRTQFKRPMCDSAIRATKDDDDGGPVVVPGTISGVSVSPTGFYVMLQLSTMRKDDMQNIGNPFAAATQKKQLSHSYVAVPITRSRRDAVAATTPQALTTLQLLAGVDMAGAILPPELLSQLVVVAGKRMVDASKNEDDDGDDPLARYVAASIRNVLTTSSSSSSPPLSPSFITAEMPRYLDQNAWTRSKIRLPATTLQDVTVRLGVAADASSSAAVSRGDVAATTKPSAAAATASFVLNCVMEGYGRYQVVLRDDDDDKDDDDADNRDGTVATTTEGTWRELLYNDDDDNAASSGSEVVTAAFCALALALRYRVPIRIIIVGDNNAIILDETTLRLRFPSYQSADCASEPAVRSAEQITRGFTIHTLQAALRLALTKRDMAAATKIRAELDRLDGEGLDRLPVQAETDVDSMQ